MADGDKIELTKSELSAKIAEAVEAAVTKASGQNSKLTDELKKARKRVEAFADFDPKDVKAAMKSAKEGRAKALEDKEEYDQALALATTEHENALGALQTKLDEALGATKKLRVKSALNAAMDDAQVAPAFRKAVSAMHKGDVTIVDQDGKAVAMVGDKPVGDYLKAWAETDEGKNFVGDGGGSGGGAGGGSGGSGGQDNPWVKETRNITMQGIIERDHPAKAVKLKQEAGIAA